MGKYHGVDRRIRAADRHREDIFGDIGEGLEITHRILGVDHARNDEERACHLFLKASHRLGDNLARAGIMTAIDPDFRILRGHFSDFAGQDTLQTAGPFHRGHGLFDHPFRHLETGGLDGADRGSGIGKLVTAGKSWQRRIGQTELVLINHAAEFFMGGKILPVDGYRATEPLRRGNQRFERRIIFLMTDDDGRTLFHDAGLFGGYQLHAVTEIGLMIERDRHDDGDGWVVDYIGCIESTA
ncbi:hypothetical protein D3C71_1239850 [compost metagenome]